MGPGEGGERETCFGFTLLLPQGGSDTTSGTFDNTMTHVSGERWKQLHLKMSLLFDILLEKSPLQ